MAKRIIVIVLVMFLALFVYVGYHSYDAKRTVTSGEVYSNGTRRVDPDTKSQSSEPETIVYPAQAAGGTTVQDQGAAPNAPQSASVQQTVAPQVGGAQITQMQQSATPAAPATDTISPNPPNGMTFSGSGRYQLYRQGNITWRLDTENGRSCVLFATDDEWKKSRVYHAGCGKS